MRIWWWSGWRRWIWARPVWRRVYGCRTRSGRAGGCRKLRGYATTTAQLLAMAGWLRHWHVQRVVRESTSTYWKGVYYLLEAEGFDCWLVNAREVKNVPGRAKTDRADAVWLAKVAERGMCRPSRPGSRRRVGRVVAA